VVVDVSGREVELLDEVEPLPGGRVTLTLDLDLQRAAYEAFDAIASAGEEPVSGAAVALDPRTGELLAMVSRPSFDPNVFAGRLDAQDWRALADDPERPLQNRALTGQYPPGSTYKALVAVAGLAEGVITPETRFFCPGSFTLGRRTYRCWKREGHGSVALHEALVRSCDVYFYQTGLAVGIDRLARYARAFGLGQVSGISLAGEKPGLVPTSAWKERRFAEPWMLGETVSASIGQGYNLLTPLQLALAYSAIANGGRVMRPRLVLSLDGPEGPMLGEPIQVTSRLPVDNSHLARVRLALAGVVQEPGGTGGRSRVPGVVVAGKTGTAQVVRLEHTEGMSEDQIPRRYRDHAWFVAFAPAEQAEIAVAVLVEHGGHGGSAAAPVAQRILARYFEKRTPAEPAPHEREAHREPEGERLASR
jgi:penicillin-binding protein 2